jgi:subtilisin family serine protease
VLTLRASPPKLARVKRSILPLLALVLATLPSGRVHATPGQPPGTDAPPAAVDSAVHGSATAERYLVRFAPGADAAVQAQALALGPMTVERVFEHVFPGAVLHVPPAAVHALEQNPNVIAIEPDREVTIGQVLATSTQSDPPWGLDRIDQRDLPLSATYSWPRDGTGVTVYVVDTGIRSTHDDFGGRVLPGFTSFNDGWGTEDCRGHGTHVAGTVGGATYGVAKGVTLRPVRVLDCNGSGTSSTVISGLDWIIGHHQPGQPAVANLSLGGTASSLIDVAVQAVVDDGVTVVAAAGNWDDDACWYSPARAPAAITVAATGSNDARAWFSNYGACVDLFAPGVGILSAVHTSDSATASYNGTSMAAPHVAGVAALHLQADASLTPAQVAAAIDGDVTTGVVSSTTGSPDKLLYSPPTGTAEPQPDPPAPPAPQPPVNDDFGTAATLSLAGPNPVLASNTDATKEPGEPLHAGNAGGASVWWNVTVPSSGTLTLTTEGSDFDTLLAVYTGTSVSSLTPIAANDDHGFHLWSRVEFQAAAGTTYRIAVDGWAGATGSVALGHAFTPFTVPAAPTGVTAVAGNAQATVAWTAPSDSGGSPILGYVATADPGGASCATTAPATTCTITGLANGVAHTVRVRAINTAGASPLSAPSTPVTPQAPPPPPPPPPPPAATGRPADDQVVRLYQAVFGRAPDASGFAYWTQQRHAGMDLTTMAGAFAISTEWVARYGATTTNTAFVDALYQNVLGRPADPGGRAHWTSVLTAGLPRPQVIVAFSESPENITRTGTAAPLTAAEGQVLRLYQAVFGRAPDASGFAYWTQQRHAGMDLTTMAGAFATSTEWIARYGATTTNTAFVDALYQNVLGRPADPGGRAHWTSVLTAGLPRPQVIVAFSESPENITRTGTAPN